MFVQTTGQMMSSVRLYLLPEYTAEGRQPHHGEVRYYLYSEIKICNETISEVKSFAIMSVLHHKHLDVQDYLETTRELR